MSAPASVDTFRTSAAALRAEMSALANDMARLSGAVLSSPADVTAELPSGCMPRADGDDFDLQPLQSVAPPQQGAALPSESALLSDEGGAAGAGGVSVQRTVERLLAQLAARERLVHSLLASAEAAREAQLRAEAGRAAAAAERDALAASLAARDGALAALRAECGAREAELRSAEAAARAAGAALAEAAALRRARAAAHGDEVRGLLERAASSDGAARALSAECAALRARVGALVAHEGAAATLRAVCDELGVAALADGGGGGDGGDGGAPQLQPPVAAAELRPLVARLRAMAAAAPRLEAFVAAVCDAVFGARGAPFVPDGTPRAASAVPAVLAAWARDLRALAPLRALREAVAGEVARAPGGAALPRGATDAQLAAAVRGAVDGQLRFAACCCAAAPGPDGGGGGGGGLGAAHHAAAASIVAHLRLLFDIPSLAGCVPRLSGLRSELAEGATAARELRGLLGLPPAAPLHAVVDRVAQLVEAHAAAEGRA